jgi:hypothetical protein
MGHQNAFLEHGCISWTLISISTKWLRMMLLGGEDHEWWFHGLMTLGHSCMTFYLDFTHRIIERFDRKYQEIHFRELAQLKQRGILEAFIFEFHRLAMMVTDISEARLVMLFVEGLLEPFVDG